MEDKRQYIRFNAEGTVSIAIDGKTVHTISAELVDICFGGLGCILNVSAQENIAEGSKVSLTLTVRLWGAPIRGEGTVKYVKKVQRKGEESYRIGIEFMDIDRKLIQSILNKIQDEICARARKTQFGR